MDQPSLHGTSLLETLVEVAVGVAQARSVQAVLTSAGNGLDEVGLGMTVLQLVPGGVRVRYTNRTPSSELGRRVRDAPVLSIESFKQALELSAPVFIPDRTRSVESLSAELGVGREAVGAAARAEGYGCELVAPLFVKGQRWGAVVLGSNSFELTDVPALSLFAAQLRSALEVAEMIEGLEYRDRELKAVHAIASTSDAAVSSHALLETIAHATTSDAVVLHRFEPESGEFVLIGDAWGYEGPLVDRWRRFRFDAFAPGQPAATSGAASELPLDSGAVLGAGFQQVTTVILTAEGHPAGFLTLARRSAAPYTTQETRTAELLGVQVSALLERARLAAEASKRVRQLQLLYEMTNAGTVTAEITPVIDRLLGQMLDAFPVDGSAIHFVEGKQLHLAGWKARPGKLPEGPPTPEYLSINDQSAIGLTVARRTPVRGSDRTFPPFTAAASKRMGFKHLLAAPLLVAERSVGTLSMVRTHDTPFTDEELKLAESCAVHIAVILEHVRLYADLKKSYDELAHTQAALVKHERLAALGELAAVMAHEVRNPLGVIFNSLASLRRLLNPEGDAALLLRMVGEEADRLNRIVGDLLDFVRPYEAVKKAIALEPILASAVDAAVTAFPVPDVRVVTQFPADLPLFQMDGHLMRQAFLNLVVNALQSMPKGGVVTVRALPEERGGKIWARVEVRDEGVGIPAESAERIFEPFFTTKTSGTGLGLAVVKRIIDAHHGEVTVQARPEGGSTFTVRLPGAAASGASQARSSAGEDEEADTLPPLAVQVR